MSETNNRSYLKDFKYTHRNPYHERLGEFPDFVLRDDEGESFAGKWREQVFTNNDPLYLEIGSGHGDFMMEFCQKNPQSNFVGLDYRFKRSFQLAKRLSALQEKAGPLRFRYLRAKGERIQFLFGENEVNGLYYFFPDPWPKARHHKKRLFQLPFLQSAYNILAPGGEIFIKTDHDDLFDWMNQVLENQNLFTVKMKSYDLLEEFPEHFLASFKTRFESLFLQQSIKVKALVLTSKKI